MRYIRARLIQCPARGVVERLDDALIAIDADGMVRAVSDGVPPPAGAAVEDLRDRGVLLPGLVDLHSHAPQFPQLGEALDLPLEDWLQRYTFPLEARYADLAFADRVYRALVRTLLANGTTTAVYFATIHLDASMRLAEICAEIGQRAVIGRVAMDMPGACPDYYRDADPAAAIDLTAAFIDRVRALDSPLVLPAVTPRFIPACSDAALEGLGALARATGAHVQTHCSESDWEHGHVLDRCGVTDAAALEGFGLLTRRTVLAHSNFVSNADLDRIRTAGAAIAHCPLSNAYFSNAVFPLRRALEKAVRVGLGADISGGPSPSLFDNCRAAITASRMLEDGVDAARAPGDRGAPDSRIDFRDAFWMATLGGAEALDLPVGLIAPGRAFDAVLVRLRDDLMASDEPQGDGLLQKIVILAGAADIRGTWVAGRRVV
jgi:guanine deaminase